MRSGAAVTGRRGTSEKVSLINRRELETNREMKRNPTFRSTVIFFSVLTVYFFHIQPSQAETLQKAYSAKPAPGVILVPGFFNSLAAGYARQSPPVPQQKALERAPYFSLAIVETLEKTGSPVVVVDNLDPLGSIETNGALMLEFLNELPKRRPQFKDREWIAIGHSCGGLYTLHALTADPNLPIKTLVTISTPFRGLGFIENLSANVPFISELASLINLESLMQLREHDVALAVAKLHPPKNLRIIATGGWQQTCSFFSCNEASTLSWILSITDALVSEISDGIVTWHSMIPDQKFLPFAIEPRPDLAVSLEHWEQVQDYRFFSLLGTDDIGTIRDRQVQFFSSLYQAAQ